MRTLNHFAKLIENKCLKYVNELFRHQHSVLKANNYLGIWNNFQDISLIIFSSI